MDRNNVIVLLADFLLVLVFKLLKLFYKYIYLFTTVIFT